MISLRRSSKICGPQQKSAPHSPEKMFGMLIAIFHLNHIADRSGFSCKG